MYDAEQHACSVPLGRSPSSHRILNLLSEGQRAASCFSRATAGDFSEDPREQNLNVSSACMFGLSRHPFSRVCHHSNLASVTSHRSWSVPVSTQSDFAVSPHENVCQPSSFQSKLRSTKTRLSWMQRLMARKSRGTLDKMSKLAFAHDGRDPRRWPQTKLCRGQHVLEQSYTANQHGAWISCARCALRQHYVPRHTARMTSVSTPSCESVQEALKRMSLLRDTDFTAKAVRDMIAEVEGRKPRKKKATPQTTIVYITMYNSGAAFSATISSGAPVEEQRGGHS